MQFLADVELTCEECKGMRFKPGLLDVKYKGRNIHDVLNMTCANLALFCEHKSNRLTIARARRCWAWILEARTVLRQRFRRRSAARELAAYLSKRTRSAERFTFSTTDDRTAL